MTLPQTAHRSCVYLEHFRCAVPCRLFAFMFWTVHLFRYDIQSIQYDAYFVDLFRKQPPSVSDHFVVHQGWSLTRELTCFLRHPIIYSNTNVPQCSHSRILTARFKPNFKRERKICRHLVTSSFERKIRKFHMVVHVKETAKKCTKKCDAGAKLLFYLLNLLFLVFFVFSCSFCILNSLISPCYE